MSFLIYPKQAPMIGNTGTPSTASAPAALNVNGGTYLFLAIA